MRHCARLSTPIPEQLEEELLKRIPVPLRGAAWCQARLGSRSGDFRPRGPARCQSRRHRGRDHQSRSAADAGDIGLSPAEPLRRRSNCRPLSQTIRIVPWKRAARSSGSDARRRYGFGPLLTALMHAFDTRVLELAVALGARPHVFPSLIGADTLNRVRVLPELPGVAHVRLAHARGPRSIARLRPLRRVERHRARDEPGCHLGRRVPVGAFRLLPLVLWLSGGRLAEPRIATAVGKCFRYESSNLSGLERLWDFTMREVMFAGSPDAVARGRERCLELATTLLDELGVAYEISSATNLFFVDAYAVQAAYQQGFELKFELLLPLPYSGGIHQRYSSTITRISSADRSTSRRTGEARNTACLGFGLERLALAFFLAQHGLNERTWPAEVVSRFERSMGRARNMADVYGDITLRYGTAGDIERVRPLWEALDEHQAQHGMLIRVTESAFDAWASATQAVLDDSPSSGSPNATSG